MKYIVTAETTEHNFYIVKVNGVLFRQNFVAPMVAPSAKAQEEVADQVRLLLTDRKHREWVDYILGVGVRGEWATDVEDPIVTVTVEFPDPPASEPIDIKAFLRS